MSFRCVYCCSIVEHFSFWRNVALLSLLYTLYTTANNTCRQYRITFSKIIQRKKCKFAMIRSTTTLIWRWRRSTCWYTSNLSLTVFPQYLTQSFQKFVELVTIIPWHSRTHRQTQIDYLITRLNVCSIHHNFRIQGWYICETENDDLYLQTVLEFRAKALCSDQSCIGRTSRLMRWTEFLREMMLVLLSLSETNKRQMMKSSKKLFFIPQYRKVYFTVQL